MNWYFFGGVSFTLFVVFAAAIIYYDKKKKKQQNKVSSGVKSGLKKK